MRIKEYVENVNTLKKEITDCNNLIEMYQDKKSLLQVQLEELLDKEVTE